MQYRTPQKQTTPASTSVSFEALPTIRKKSSHRRTHVSAIAEPRRRSRAFRDLCTAKDCTGCALRSRKYNRECYLHLLQCIAYRVSERLYYDADVPPATSALIRAFARAPQAFWESNRAEVLQIPRLLLEHAQNRPHPNHREQRWRLKHIEPMPILFEKLVECSPTAA